MLKAIYVFSRNTSVSLAEFHQHWYEVHGMHHVTPGHHLRDYIQHHTFIPAYDAPIKPTHDGASIIWIEDIPTLIRAVAFSGWKLASEDSRNGVHGGRPLFGGNMNVAVAREEVVLEGATDYLMMKAIWTWRRHPEIAEADFYAHLRNVHGPLCAKIPGVRRYVQNHGVDSTAPAESGEALAISHDGWSELWFDDFDALVRATKSEEWARLEADIKTGPAGNHPLFDEGSVALVIGRECHMMTSPLPEATIAAH